MKSFVVVVLLCWLSVVFCDRVHLGFPSFHPRAPVGRVVGGKEAPRHAAPYIVSLQNNGRHFCAGSLISEDTALTAAHCIIYQKFEAVAGAHSLGSGKVQIRSVVRSIPKKEFEGGVGPNDIALIFLEKPFEFGETVQKIALPNAGAIPVGTATLYGWGSTSNTVFPIMPRNLQTVQQPLLAYDVCEMALGGPGATPLAESNVCAGPLTGGISACSGDSGGPLVQQENGTTTLIGIVSWGYIPCGTKNAPSVYTRVSAFIDWIGDNV